MERYLEYTTGWSEATTPNQYSIAITGARLVKVKDIDRTANGRVTTSEEHMRHPKLLWESENTRQEISLGGSRPRILNDKCLLLPHGSYAPGMFFLPRSEVLGVENWLPGLDPRPLNRIEAGQQRIYG